MGEHSPGPLAQRMRAAPMPHAPGVATQLRIPFVAGDLACHVLGSGPPVLLVHSVNAAASAAEMAALAENLAADHRVWNLDLPGFGLSERTDVHYDVARFVAAVDATMEQLLEQEQVEAADAVALSLSCEFLARSAARRPGRYRSLTFITPTGFQRGGEKLVEPEGATFEKRWLSALLATPAGKALYAGLTRPASIRFFLKRTFGRDDVDRRVLEAALANARVRGAEHAPLAFVSGRLFSRDIAHVYRSLTQPIWMPHGVRGAFADMSASGWTRERPNWRLQPFDAGAMPHVEDPALFTAELRRHVAAAAGAVRDHAAMGAP